MTSAVLVMATSDAFDPRNNWVWWCLELPGNHARVLRNPLWHFSQTLTAQGRLSMC